MGKIFIGLGKAIFPNSSPPAFLGNVLNRVRKHLLFRMNRLVDIATDLLICGLVKPGTSWCTHSSAASRGNIHKGHMGTVWRVKQGVARGLGKAGALTSWWDPEADQLHGLTHSTTASAQLSQELCPLLLQYNLFLIRKTLLPFVNCCVTWDLWLGDEAGIQTLHIINLNYFSTSHRR